MEIDYPKTRRPAMQRGAAAARECVRVFSTTALSLLPPLWLLLFARIAAARRHPWSPTNYEDSYVIYIFLLHSVTTVVLISVIFAAAAAALVRGFAGGRSAWLVGQRRRLHGAVIWLSLVQVCLILWAHGVADGGSAAAAAGAWGTVTLFRSVVLALGLHEMVVYWRRSVVKPVVDDEAVFGESSEGTRAVERVVLAAVFGCLWWLRLRGEVEAMVAVRKDMKVVDVLGNLGWLCCGFMAAAGGARVIKGFLWLMTKILRRHASVNKKIGAAADKSWGSRSEIETAV